MGMIVVKLEGRKLFAWAGTDEAIAAVESAVPKAAQVAGMTAIDFAGAAIVHLGAIEKYVDDAQRTLHVMEAIYFLLRQPMGGKPGAVVDYLPAWDFEFDFSRSGQRLGMDVTAASPKMNA